MSSLSISTSGLLASTAMLANAAADVADVRSVGAASSATTASRQSDVVDIGNGGGARALPKAAPPAYTATGAPASATVPDIDPVQSTLGQITAQATSEANVAAIKTAMSMLQGLLSTVA
jgi:flagellar basal body rod protein FlgC